MTEERSRRDLREMLGGRVEREVEDEVRFHLEKQIEDLIAAGWSPDAAREEARRMFGDMDRVSGELRSLTSERRRRARRREYAGELWADLRFALRRIRRRPLFSFVTVLVLAVGIGANAAIFGVVDAALLRPLPFPDGDEIVFLWDDQDGDRTPVSFPEYRDWRREARFLQALAGLYFNSLTHQGPEGPERLRAVVVGGDILGVAGLSPVIGRGILPQDVESGSRVVALGEGFWRDRFGGSPNVLGTTLSLNGESYEVVGVMPDELAILGETTDFRIWIPLVERPWMSRGMHLMRVVGRLDPGVSLEEARSRGESMAAGLRESGVTRHGLIVQPVRERLVGDVRPLLLLLWGAVGFLLLIVCTNLANLFLSQAAGRAREFAVRSALGAGAPRLVRQLLTESLTLGLVGAALGLALSRLAIGYVADAAERASLLADPGIDLRVLAFTAAITLLTSAAFGLAPLARLVSRRISADLRDRAAGRFSGGRGVRRFGRFLVGAQVALSVILLVGAGLLVGSVVRLLNQDPGFDPSGVVSLEIDLPPTRYAEDEVRVRFFDEVLRRVRALPGVSGAAAISHVPLSGSDTYGGFGIPGREYTPEEAPSSQKRIATPGYFETMRIPLVSGRTFEDRDGREGREVAIIDRSLAERYWPDADPVGQRIRFAWGTDGEQEIVGVVSDVHHDGLDQPAEGTIYVPNAVFAAPGLSLVVRSSGDPVRLVPAIRGAVQEVDPLQPVHEIATLDAIVRRSLTTRRVFMTLLTGFAAVALLLAAVGVYAVTAGSVSSRVREIGVRLAMGAAPRKVLNMIVVEELKVIVPGLVVGMIGAFALSRSLRALLFQISSNDPVTFAAVALVLSLVALLAVWIPARRAAGMDPTEALRTE